MKLTLHPYDLPLRHPFAISRGSIAVHHALLWNWKRMVFADSARPAPTRTTGRASTNGGPAGTAPCRGGGPLDRRSGGTLGRVSPWLGSCRFAQCALDMACHDLWGKFRRAPVWKLWGLSLDKLPATDYTIGIDTIDRMVAKLRSSPAGRSTRSSSARRTTWKSSAPCAGTPPPCSGWTPTVVGPSTERSPTRRRCGIGRGTDRAAAAGRRLGRDGRGFSRIRPCR